MRHACGVYSPEEGEKKRPAGPFHHCGAGRREEMGATLIARCCCCCRGGAGGGSTSTGAAVAMPRLRLSPSPRWLSFFPYCSSSLALTAISIDGLSVTLKLVSFSTKWWMNIIDRARCGSEEEGEGLAFKEDAHRGYFVGVVGRKERSR